MNISPVYSFIVAIILLQIWTSSSLPFHQVQSDSKQTDFPWNYQNVSQILYNAAQSDTNLDVFSYLCDVFGPRYRGTPNLENALNWIYLQMNNQGLANVAKEPVYNITNWVRGREHLIMNSPRNYQMHILGLGNSVGTPANGITAQIIVVSSWDDLAAKADQVPGKIVVYNVPFTTYGETVQYRSSGASQAAKYGAVAALVRSVTPFSLYTPHTGAMWYDSSLPMIPTAAITVEDAEILARLQGHNVPVTVTLYMEAHQAPLTSSWNVMAEVTGSQYPNEVVVLGGHSDSWDVGQGAIDDGAGFYSAWEAVRIINDLVNQGEIPRPKRTIRVVLWVDEEISQKGASTYMQDHITELDDHVLAMESDSGNFGPTGFSFSGTPDALQIMQEIGFVLLSPFGAGTIVAGGPSADIAPLTAQGVPGASLNTVGSEDPGNPINAIYFYYHHTNADTITHLNVTGVKNSVATFAITSYVVADMDEKLPR